ncbi:hypothetical protein TNCV_1078191 [Trichonephila clavipes]|nr:hypothetical protein TNCV_1078191 [Trichonephila clavipes]
MLLVDETMFDRQTGTDFAKDLLFPTRSWKNSHQPLFLFLHSYPTALETKIPPSRKFRENDRKLSLYGQLKFVSIEIHNRQKYSYLIDVFKSRATPGNSREQSAISESTKGTEIG